MKAQKVNKQKLFVHEIFRVLYSPLEAFKEIVKKPDVKGPMLILLITVLATAGAQYISASKTFFEYPMPETDSWTESTSFWNSNGNLSIVADCVVRNYSVMSSVSNNDTCIWMKRTNIGPLNCTGAAGYRGISFRIKWVHPNGTPPSSDATLWLFSSNESRYFELDILHHISNSSNKWYNITDPVEIGPESQGWDLFDFPDWESVTALEFRLCWPVSDAANLTMKIDELYFGNYTSYSAKGFFNEVFVHILVRTPSDFIVRWGIFTGLLLLVIKMFGGETGRWSGLFNVIGYVFSVGIISIFVEAFLINLLPPLYFPLKAWVHMLLPGSTHAVSGETGIAVALIEHIYQENWYSTLAYGLRDFVALVFHVWTVALGTIAIHFLREFTWKKSVAIVAMAYIMLFFVMPSATWLMRGLGI